MAHRRAPRGAAAVPHPPPDDDIELLRRIAEVLGAGFPLVAVLQIVRVYGNALAGIADAEIKLFHLYVHEPLMRDGMPGLVMAEMMSELAEAVLPLASPIMDALHQRHLHHFVEQDVVGHMEAEGAGARAARAARARARVMSSSTSGGCGWRSRSPTSPATRASPRR